ncbi:helix-turn-helix transcriptional regulator [bacterium]|nr:helix-turn-helix transcriptional regulator [bacterium]
MTYRSRALNRMPARGEGPSTSRPRSPSIDILKRALEVAGVNRKTFVKETELSYEYVSRIFNSKVKFPTVRETLERFAEVAKIDPMVFPEYQQLVSVLPESTRKLWNRLQEVGLTRQEFANRVDISRTYMYEILRGDVPFPRNPEVIEKIAEVLEVAPETFGEYLAPVQDWAERNPLAIEHVFMNLLVTKMLIARGHLKEGGSAEKISDEMLSIFPAEDRYEPVVRKIMAAMGKGGYDVRKLALEADVPERDVRLLLMGQIQTEDLPETARKLKELLKVS